MKKKSIFAVFTVLIVVVLLCSACVKPKSSILHYCDRISDAKNATQVITVKSGSDELSKETRSYDFVTGIVSIERKTLNDSNADELYTTTTETKDIDGNATAKFTKDLLSDVTETATTLKATVSNANLNEVFGIASSDVVGDAKVEISAQDKQIVSIMVSYTSSSGNKVEILTTYVY